MKIDDIKVSSAPPPPIAADKEPHSGIMAFVNSISPVMMKPLFGNLLKLIKACLKSRHMEP